MKNVSKASGISMNVLHTNVDYAAIIREFEMYGRVVLSNNFVMTVVMFILMCFDILSAWMMKNSFCLYSTNGLLQYR